MLLITAAPLTEMVWSQQEGLSLQCVTSSLGEKKASVIWNTESFNMAVSSPKCANYGESSNSEDPTEGDTGFFPNEGGSLIRIDEHSSKVDSDNQISGNNRVDDDEEVDNDANGFNTIEPDTNTVDKIQHKLFVPGPNIPGQGPDILQTNVECASNIRSSHNTMKESDQMEIYATSSMVIRPAGHGFLLRKHENKILASSSSKSIKRRYMDLDLNMKEYKNHKAKHESFQTSHKDKSALVPTGKGKEQIISDTEDSKSVSKESEDSHDSVESCSSKSLMPINKRARSHDMKMSTENKRLKKQIFEGSTSGSLQGQTSSFMNWVSTITNGFSRFIEATPLSFVPPPSHNIDGNNNCVSDNMGFKSIFQSLYLPGFNARSTTKTNLKVGTGSEEFGCSSSQIQCKKVEFNLHRILPTNDMRVDFVSLHVVCNEGNDEVHNKVSLPRERLNKSIHHVKEYSSTKSNVSLSDSRLNLGNNGSTCSSRKDGTLVAVAESSSKLVSDNKSEFLENLWITRFSPKVSSKKELATKSLAKNYSLVDPLVESQINDLDGKKLEHLTIGNEKFKSKLNPILPSHKFQKADSSASFAKRLDALRYSKLTKATESAQLTTATCLFCGKNSHGTSTCS